MTPALPCPQAQGEQHADDERGALVVAIDQHPTEPRTAVLVKAHGAARRQTDLEDPEREVGRDQGQRQGQQRPAPALSDGQRTQEARQGRQQGEQGAFGRFRPQTPAMGHAHPGHGKVARDEIAVGRPAPRCARKVDELQQRDGSHQPGQQQPRTHHVAVRRTAQQGNKRPADHGQGQQHQPLIGRGDIDRGAAAEPGQRQQDANADGQQALEP